MSKNLLKEQPELPFQAVVGQPPYGTVAESPPSRQPVCCLLLFQLAVAPPAV
jgi:hypothetical protein